MVLLNARVWLARMLPPFSTITKQRFHPTARPRVNAHLYSIAILGNDAMLAALPAHPVQLMHAALAVGFDAVVPASLGDELVAGETLRLAQLRGRRPVVQCACPYALRQLCKREANLHDITLAVAPAAVALARALRMQRTETTHITYIGACPGAQDSSIDLQVLPAAFLRGLLQRGVGLQDQPQVFTDRLPPDRRRFLSVPGGAPRPELIQAVLRRSVVTLGSQQNPMLAVADALFEGGATMIDPAGAYRCVCTGAVDDRDTAEGRAEIERLEPVRALAPIFEAPAWLDLRPSETGFVGDLPAADHQSPPLAFSDAAGVEGRVEGRADTPARADAPPSGDAARRMYALGVRSVRRRGAQAPQDPDATGALDSDAEFEIHIPSTSPKLHAPVIERDVPLGPALARFALGDDDALHAPAASRALAHDDLHRRD